MNEVDTDGNVVHLTCLDAPLEVGNLFSLVENLSLSSVSIFLYMCMNAYLFI